MSDNTSAASPERRYRRFSVTSKVLTRAEIERAMTSKNARRWAGAIHDKDGGHPYDEDGATPDGHLFMELHHARTVITVCNMFTVPVQVKPVVGPKGDKNSFIRGVRYLTHEDPRQQASGKFHYSDDEIFASDGFDWRAEVDELTAREGYAVPLLAQLRMEVFTGDRTAASIGEDFPWVYLDHYRTLQELQREGHLMRQANERARAMEEARRQREAELASIRAVVDELGQGAFLSSLFQMIEGNDRFRRDLRLGNRPAVELHPRIKKLVTSPADVTDESFFVEPVATAIGLTGARGGRSARLLQMIREETARQSDVPV